MTNVLGMDIQQVTDLATAMGNNADQITTITSQLTSLIDQTTWTGQDNQQFRSDWDGTYSVQLRNIVEQLNERKSHLMQEVQQQQQASGN